eukprot:Filipodium_phascolosomae@DN1107_c0_g1_i1.p1
MVLELPGPHSAANSGPVVHKFNILVLGEKSVGKTSIIMRLSEGVFDDSYITTLGVDLKRHFLTINNNKVQLQLWDTAGQERYRTITPNYYRQAAGILLVFDICRAETFDLIDTWMHGIKEHATPDTEAILVGNKADIASRREVNREAASIWADRHGMPYFETSAKTGANISETFTNLADRIYMSRNHDRGEGDLVSGATTQSVRLSKNSMDGRSMSRSVMGRNRKCC